MIKDTCLFPLAAATQTLGPVGRENPRAVKLLITIAGTNKTFNKLKQYTKQWLKIKQTVLKRSTRHYDRVSERIAKNGARMQKLRGF
jgi:hypothetical protein